MHKAKDGVIGVLAVMINEGKHNKAYDPVCANLPDPESNEPESGPGEAIDTESLLPRSRR